MIGGKIPLFRQVTNCSRKLLKRIAVIWRYRDGSMAKSVIFVVSPRSQPAQAALSARMSLCVEPTHHDAVEGLGTLDIREVAGVDDFLIAAARNETRETAVFAPWRVGILGTARHSRVGRKRSRARARSRRAKA